jgi:phage replication initiation protein
LEDLKIEYMYSRTVNWGYWLNHYTMEEIVMMIQETFNEDASFLISEFFDFRKRLKLGAKTDCPRMTNRGAENTSQSGLRACVDWVQATFKIAEVEQLIREILRLNPKLFYEADNGGLGYKKCKRFGSISIFYDGREDMGIHLQMKGQGCREYELLEKSTWKELFVDCLLHKAKFTRVDIAIDDFGNEKGKPYFKIPSLIRKIKNGELVSKFKRARRIEDIEIETGEGKGVTIHYGSGQSRIQVRMYEKNHERESKGFKLEEGLEVWNRTEIQARNERAQGIVQHIVDREDGEESIGQVVRAILKEYIDFKVKGTDSNRSRWDTAPFWNKFLGDVKGLKLTEVAPDRTVERTYTWVDNQVAPSLAILYEAFNGDMSKIEDMISSGKGRLKERDYKMIEAYKNEQKKYSSMPLEERLKA